MKTIVLTVSTFCLLFLTVINGICQNPIQFTGVNATPENAMQLHWQSNSNEVYEIDYANELATNTDGSTAWAPLCQDYPSQGTNTFWLDTGNYTLTPNILHPKNMFTRFYRVLITGTNAIAANPIVLITSITNGQLVAGSLIVSVSVNCTDVVIKTALYVDGQEMQPTLDGTNFIINTCEWWNGDHTIFATVKSASGLEGNFYNQGITYGYGVSPMVDVAFNNLVTEIKFSQPYFQPSLGQTQHVSAVMALNSDWTLRICDVNSNLVRTVTGSGNYLDCDWDGTGDGETNIADGVYKYYISASTNGLPNNFVISGGVNVSINTEPPSPGGESEMMRAVNNDDETVAPMSIFPLGMDSSNYTAFSDKPSEVKSLHLSSRSSFTGGGFTPSYTPLITPLPGDPQDAPYAPSRPPNNPVKGMYGTYGIAYQEYPNPNATGQVPTTGWPRLSGQPQWVAIDGRPAPVNGIGATLKFGNLYTAKTVVDGLSRMLQSGAYYQSFCEANDDVTIHALTSTPKGGLGVFNTVNFGFLVTHGSYSTTAESDGVKYSYIWIASGGTVQYMRLSDFSFGGGEPSGLRWMTVCGCDVLNQTDYNSMASHSRNPLNNSLHILLGANTVNWLASDIGINYGDNLTTKNESVINSWYDAGTFAYTYQYKGITNTIVYATVADTSCTSDTLQTFSSPGGTLHYDQTTVFTYSP